MALIENQYKEAFLDVLDYQEDKVEKEKDHFPVFLMGNSFVTLGYARAKIG